jgi:hypothetical protein
MYGQLVGINLNDFRRATEGRSELRELFGRPYTACFLWAAARIIQAAMIANNSERFAFFHEINDYKEDACRAFDFLKKNLNPKSNFLTLSFGDKGEYVPLQAADVLAYEGNKRLRDIKRPERRAFSVLARDKLLSFRYFDKSNIGGLMEGIKEIQMDIIRSNLRVLGR